MKKNKYIISLEDNFKGIDYTVVNSNDPIISLCGGACTFNNNSNIINRIERFLRYTPDVEKAMTNNPSLIEECNNIKNASSEAPVIIFNNELLKMFSKDEEKAILYHELGHIHHEHNKKSENGTAGSFIEMELEADQYAVNELGPKVLHDALEKSLAFGSKFSIVAVKESSPSFIKKLLNYNIINKYMIGAIYKANRKIHSQRFKTLKELEKQMK